MVFLFVVLVVADFFLLVSSGTRRVISRSDLSRLLRCGPSGIWIILMKVAMPKNLMRSLELAGSLVGVGLDGLLHVLGSAVVDSMSI